jgi:phosphatidylserine/phosphatidylglycerophosphate/cardiolipin synthase-like enzyme
VDFSIPLPRCELTLIEGRRHYEQVIGAVRRAERSIWIATANLKELMIEDGQPRLGRRRRDPYVSVLELFDELVARGVEIRLLHAAPPSRAFRNRFDVLPRLVKGGIELRMCPRVHLKTVIVDGRLLYLGSANWTGAGLGAKGEGRRNFELGLITEDEAMLDAVQGLFDELWRGRRCGTCRVRDTCEMPLSEQ